MQIKQNMHPRTNTISMQSVPHKLRCGVCLLLSCVLVVVLSGVGALVEPQVAWAVTSAQKKAEANAAVAKLDKLQTEINRVEGNYLQAEQERATAESKRNAAQAREKAAKKRIAELQEQLGQRANSMYRNGNISFLDVMFGATTFTEFVEMMDLVGRINTKDADLVVESKTMKEQATAARIEYTEQEQVARVKAEEVGALLRGKEAAAASMRSEISKLKKEFVKIQAQEVARAAAAKALRDAEVANNGAGNTTISPELRALVPSFVHPAPGFSITSGFGYRSLDRSYHLGTDYGCPTGTGIKAAAAGTVIISGYGSSTGNYIAISHGNGVVTKYMHASRLNVSVGEKVAQGQVIMISGNTGNSTGPHLHFQVEINGTAYNPLLFL